MNRLTIKKTKLFIFSLLLYSITAVLIGCEKNNTLDATAPTIKSSSSLSAQKTVINEINVLSFNVLCPCWAHPSYYPASTAPLLNRVLRRQVIIDFLKSYQNTVDVFALQEVAQAEFNFFNDALKQNYQGFQANHDSNYWSSWITVNPPWEINGNALFVRKDRFTNISFQDFPASTSGNHAALFTGIIRNSNGKLIRVASVHLDSDYPYNRKAELNAVLNKWTTQTNTVDIIAGDFNTETDATNLKADILRVGYYDVLEVLGKATQTHPWDSKYNGADNWGIIDHVISRNTSAVDGKVIDFSLYQLFPNDEEMRINRNLQLCGSDHFPIMGSVSY